MEKEGEKSIISRIRKRDGRIVLFDQERITDAIFKAAQAVGGKDKKLAKKLSDEVVNILERKFGSDIVPTVEQIQDIVEKVLIENGHAKTAKAYILYREQRRKIREMTVLLNSIEIIDNYVSQLDWRVKENSNMGYSLQGLNNHITTTIVSKYWLNKIYPDYVREAHENARMHIHDLGTLGAYCCGWDLKDLLMTGFRGVSGKTESKAPKHFRTALGQMVNFFYTIQGEIAGAIAFSNFDTLLAPFIHYDRLNRKGIKQAMQEFIFNMNVPTRVGFQSPFTNLTLDLKVPDFMKDENVVIGGKIMAKKYKDFQEEMDWINDIFAEIMMTGDAKSRIFTFPIPTYNITKDFDWDNPAYDTLWKMTAKFGVPYFSNFIHADMKPEDARSMCPLAGDEKVLIRSSRGRIVEYSMIRQVYEGNSKQEEYEIYSNGKFVKGRFNKFKDQQMISVKLDNNHEIKMSKNHLNYVIQGKNGKELILKGEELKKGMYLPYSLKYYKGEGGNKDLGYFVGAYAGDGSFNEDSAVIFSLEQHFKKETITKLTKIANDYFGAHTSITKNKKTKLVTLKVYSKAAVGLCKDFVEGIQREKRYKAKLFIMSQEFRKGVLEGHYATDGGNRHRIYTSSKKMVETLNMLAATIGTTTSIYKDNRKGRLGKEPNYAVLFYQLNRKNYGKIWFKKRGKLWVRIKEIKLISNDTAYCFEVKNEEPMFTIGTTGILTHNCRLRLDNRELRKRGGGLFGANPLTGCYDKNTEILTQEGWKFFKDLTKEDNIFTLNDKNEIEVHKPKSLFEYNYNGEMYHFKAKSLNLLVTPNHRMVVDRVPTKKREFVEAKDFDVNNQRIPKQSIWQSNDEEWFILPSIEFTKYGRQGKTPYQVTRDTIKIKMDDWLAFFGFWLAEGCTDNEKIAKRHGYRTVVSQVNREKKEEFKKLLNNLPFVYAEEKNNLVICNKQLWTYLRQFGNKYRKFIPKKIKSLSRRQLRILFDWAVKGDGHVRKTTGQINYWTASKSLADDMQEIILKLGWLGTLTFQDKKSVSIKGRKFNSNRIYILGVQKAGHYRLRKCNIQKVHYNGKVYCCEVKNNTVFVRRNGKVCWCGNSIGVVTLNMAQLGYLSKNETEFFERLEEIMKIAKDSLEIKRKILEDFTDVGLYPYSKFYLRNTKEGYKQYWKNHFSTIGLNGMNEALLNLLNTNIASEEGIKFTIKVLDFMRERISKYQEETGNLYNLEATPAEGTSYRLAKIDKKLYPEIIVANEKAWQERKAAPFYTNSTQLPVDYTDDIFEALKLQEEIQILYTGGVVLHGFLGEQVSSIETTKQLVRKIAENFKIPYYTLTPTFSVCPIHGYLQGEHEYCPKCDEEIGYKGGEQEEWKQKTEPDVKSTAESLVT